MCATVFPHCKHSVLNIPCPSDLETSATNLQHRPTLNATMLHAVTHSSDFSPAATSIVALYITQKFPQKCSYTLYIDNDHNGNVHNDISDCQSTQIAPGNRYPHIRLCTVNIRPRPYNTCVTCVQLNTNLSNWLHGMCTTGVFLGTAWCWTCICLCSTNMKGVENMAVCDSCKLTTIGLDWAL